MDALLTFSTKLPISLSADAKKQYERNKALGMFDEKKGGLFVYGDAKKTEAVLLVPELDKKHAEELQHDAGNALLGLKGKFPAAKSITVTVAVDASAKKGKEHFEKGAYLASLTNEDHFKSKKSSQVITVKGIDADLKKILDAVQVTRLLTSTPANILTTDAYVKEIVAKCKPYKDLTVKILRKKELMKEKMGLLLAVGTASVSEPALAVIEYSPKKAPKEAPVLLVGKGVIYDCGGYAIKPGDYMADMYADMAGSATVLGIMLALAELGVQKKVVGVLPICENLINEKAFKNGDILTSRKGLTVEIDNTDAEGRLILADALHYGQEKFKPSLTLDYATLTGAAAYSLGDLYAGIFTDDRKLTEKFMDLGEEVNDFVWPLPFDHLIKRSVENGRSDITNTSSIKRALGASTAAAFLAKFVTDTKKWVHFDIAGCGMRQKQRRSYDFKSLHGSGGMVHTTVRFLMGK